MTVPANCLSHGRREFVDVVEHFPSQCRHVIEARPLKKAILHRKNSLFFKTQNGADVSDLHMSLIYTCERNGANPRDYLVELRRHAEELAAAPAEWMPWNYREAVARATTAKAPSAACSPLADRLAPIAERIRSTRVRSEADGRLLTF